MARVHGGPSRGTLRGTGGIVRPITAADLSTLAAWRTLLDRLTVGTVIADRTGTIIYANDAVSSLLGWTA